VQYFKYAWQSFWKPIDDLGLIEIHNNKKIFIQKFGIKRVLLNMLHISNIEMRFIEQLKLQNKTITNNKSHYTSMTPKIFGKLHLAYWKLTLKLKFTFCNIGPELAKTITPPSSVSSHFSHSHLNLNIFSDGVICRSMPLYSFIFIMKNIKTFK